ncbi:hypothetical protein, partial [Paenibacillus durus]|uniref:hypothetical protein n=1 Tax=Paenibacillus durus TaxID=44251 RepID=UPI001B80BCEF
TALDTATQGCWKRQRCCVSGMPSEPRYPVSGVIGMRAVPFTQKVKKPAGHPVIGDLLASVILFVNPSVGPD